MNLALVIPGPLDRRSGGYSYDTDFVDFCRGLGHSVEVWSLPLSPSAARRELETRLAGDRAVIFDALVHPAVVELLERLRPRSTNLWIGLVHHLAWLEDPRPDRTTRRKQNRERRFLETMDAYLFNSEDTRRSVVTLRGPQAGFRPGVVLRPPLAHQSFLPAPGQGRLLFLGNLVPRKNLVGLLEALSLLATRRPELPWSLTVAGSPDLDARYATRCRDWAKTRGLEGRVVWAGRVTETKKASLWAETDLLALPSFHEGWGMAHAEALARGIPSLAVCQGGVAEVLGDAALWTAADPEAQSRQLERYLEDPDFQTDLRLRVRHRSLIAGTTGFGPLESFLGHLDEHRTNPGRAWPEVGFEDYLEAKATVDSRSLAPRVTEAVFSDGVPRTVLELGGGTGTMARRLLDWGKITPDTRYEVVDQNTAALAQAQILGAPRFSPGRFQTRKADLRSVWEDSREAPDLVVAHALLDLFDPRTAAPALAHLAARRYWLTHLFDGLTAWEPQVDSDLDQALVRAYHQSMDDRAPGGALGSSRSGRDWLTALPGAGFRILEAGSSDWIVRPDAGRYPDQEAVFLRAILGFFRSSLTGRPDVDQNGLRWWLTVREHQIAGGQAVFLARQLDIAAERIPGFSPGR